MTGFWKKGLAVISSAALVATVLASCGTTSGNTGGNTTTTGTPVSGGKITLDINDDLAHLDPALAYDQGSWDYTPQFYDQLVTYKPQSTDIVADLAKEWKVSDDGLTYTFTLRQDAKFWNGKAVTAQTFVDQFKRILNKSLNSPAVGFIDPAIMGADDFYTGKSKDLPGVIAQDDHTLVIKLTNPEPFFLKVLAMPFFSPVDVDYIKSIGGDKAFDHQPMGDGPFKFKSYENGKGMVMVKNTDYWNKDKPKLDEIDVNINHNQDASALSFEQGNTALMGDYSQTIPAQSYVKWVTNPQYKDDIIKQPFLGVYYLGMNTQVKPFDSKQVRQAINMAIDKDTIVKLTNGRGVPTNQIIPPGMQGHEDSLPDAVNYKFDSQKAKDLLAQAGYKNGFSVEMLVRNRQPLIGIAESIQSNLKAIGVTVTLREVGESDYLSKAESGKEPMGIYGWFADFPDPYDFLDVLLNSNQAPVNNWADYKNPDVDKMLKQAATMKEGPDRYQLYQQIQEKVLADAPWVPLYTPEGVYIHQPWVKGYYTSPVLEDPFQDMWVTQH